MPEPADEPPSNSNPEAQEEFYRQKRKIMYRTHWKSVLGLSIICAVGSGYYHQTYPTSSSPTYSSLSSYASSLEWVAQSAAPTREEVLALAERDDSGIALWNVPNNTYYFNIRKEIAAFADAYDPHIRSDRVILQARFDAYADEIREIGKNDLARAQSGSRAMSSITGIFGLIGVVGAGMMLYNSRKKE